MKKFLLVFLLVLAPLSVRAEPLDLLISAEQIEEKITEVALQINEDYKDKDLTIVMIMKGAVCVTADLIRHLDVPFKLEYAKASSYGYNGTVSGTLKIHNLENIDIENRDVLLVDDIFETGKTIVGVMNILKDKHPRSMKTLLLLVKDVPRTISYCPDYVLFTIPNRFVIGYGLDYKELYRGLSGVYAFPNDTPPF